MRVIGLAATAAFTIAPFAVLAPVAQAGPLCPQSMAQFPSIYQQCLTAEQNQNYCTDASGCTPGDPCVVGSAYEKAICDDSRAAGR